MQMVMYIKDNGQMIWQMVMVHIYMLVELNMKVIGLMINNTVLV